MRRVVKRVYMKTKKKTKFVFAMGAREDVKVQYSKVPNKSPPLLINFRKDFAPPFLLGPPSLLILIKKFQRSTKILSIF